MCDSANVDIRLGKVITRAKQRLDRDFSDGVCQAIAEIQGSFMLAPSESGLCCEGLLPMMFTERDDCGLPLMQELQQ